MVQQLLKDKKGQFKNTIRALETVSPLATLSKEYSIVSNVSNLDDEKNEKIVRSIKDVKEKDKLRIKVQDGIINASVIVREL